MQPLTRGGRALDLLAEKVAAYEKNQDFELTPDISVASYLRWWTDVELVEQIEDGLITATTRKAYLGQVNNHILGHLGAVTLRDLSAAKVRSAPPGGGTARGRRAVAAAGGVGEGRRRRGALDLVFP